MYQASFVTPAAGAPVHVVDLHWRIANPQAFGRVLEYEELAAAAEPLPALSPSARGLGRVHALMLACVLGYVTSHAFESQFLYGESMERKKSAPVEERLRSGQPPDQICRQLVRDANHKGGLDNVTVVLLQVEEDGDLAAD